LNIEEETNLPAAITEEPLEQGKTATIEVTPSTVESTIAATEVTTEHEAPGVESATTTTEEEAPLPFDEEEDDEYPGETIAITHDRATLLRGGLATWQAKMAQRREQQQQAAEVDRKKILQDALTTWRYKLRSQMVETKVRARIAREALNKMVLAERCAHFQKQQKQKALMAIMQKLAEKKQKALEAASFQQEQKQKHLKDAMRAWAEKAKKAKEQKQQQEAVAQGIVQQKAKANALKLWYGQMVHQHEMENTALSYTQPRLLQSTLTKWREQTQQTVHQREMENTALTFYQPRLVQDTLSKWRERRQKHQKHLQQLEIWSKDADFYFRASRTLKKWREATEASKREKRKIAYTQVRRMIKINLARAVLQGWREKAQHLIALKKQAQAIDANKLVVIGINLFDKWRNRATEVADMEEIARKHVLKKHMAAWKQRRVKDAEVANMEAIAREHVLRKHLTLWQQRKAKDAEVAAMEEVARKHTLKKFFALWKQRLEDQRSLEEQAALTYQESRQTQVLKKWNIFERCLRIGVREQRKIDHQNLKQWILMISTTDWAPQQDLRRGMPQHRPKEGPYTLQHPEYYQRLWRNSSGRSINNNASGCVT
jgi:protein SFI1